MPTAKAEVIQLLRMHRRTHLILPSPCFPTPVPISQDALLEPSAHS